MVRIEIKTPDEVANTLRERTACDRGFLAKRWAVALCALVLLGFIAGYMRAIMAVLLVLLVDFFWFVMRRGRTLKRWEAGRPRLISAEDFSAVSSAYEQAGIREPTMTDFEAAAGFSGRPEWQRDLRYQIAAREYESGHVADIGCGDGRLCWKYKISSPEQYTGVDVGRDLLRVLRDQTGGKAKTVEGTAEQTGLPSESQDLVVCTEAFEHLPEPGPVLREFVRILKPGGRIFIQSPSATRLRNFNPFHILQTVVGRAFPCVLQRTMVHENTFIRAYTYHWDFTRQDFKRYVEGLPLMIEQFYGAMYRLDPQRSVTHKVLHGIATAPLFNLFWWDLTIVLRKSR
ncbi:MAG TPA: class I SAM-dependent methyltransferase [Methylomirabilota bacterium]|jgi:ubiquinone/menaquinone biosynthesis C-methylase UbiE